MPIRSDSYSDSTSVLAFTKHLLNGQSAFNSTTRPTMTEVIKFIDRASGVLNIALSSAGFAPAAIIANSTAKLACDEFVTEQAVVYVELTQRGVGYSDQQGSRTASFKGLSIQKPIMATAAQDFVGINKLGFQRLGVTQQHPLAEGLQFTAIGDQADRPDITDSTLEQPFFKRRQFDTPKSQEGQVVTETGDLDE